MRFGLLALALLLAACSDETTVDTAEEAAESVDLSDEAPLPTVPTTAEMTLPPNCHRTAYDRTSPYDNRANHTTHQGALRVPSFLSGRLRAR